MTEQQSDLDEVGRVDTSLNEVSKIIQIDSIVGSRYKLVRQLGQGGMGEVWLAKDLNLDNMKVAIKFLRVLGSFSQREEYLQRFRNESVIMSRLSSTYLVNVRDRGGLNEGVPYIVMDYLEGTNLAKKIELDGPLSWQETITIVRDVAKALKDAHALQVVHRDLKPGNIFLETTPSGETRIKVLDFGIAKCLIDENTTNLQTRSGIVVGTPQYMAPEQFTTDPVGPPCDLFALGVVTYQCLTGKLPLGVNIYNTLDIPAALQELLFALLDTHAIKRPTPKEVITKLDEIEADQLTTKPDLPKRSNTITSINYITVAVLFLILGSILTNYIFIPITPLPLPIQPKTAVVTQTESTPAPDNQLKDNPIQPDLPVPSENVNTPKKLPPTKDVKQTTKPKPKTLSSAKTMAKITSGSFWIGCVPNDKNCKKDERPRHRVYLDTYYIDKTEVTVAAYQNCVKKGINGQRCTIPRKYNSRNDYEKHCNYGRKNYGKHPINCITWTQAKRFCELHNKSLPSEAQWERAAKMHENDIYPWGNKSPTSRLAIFAGSRDTNKGTAPVASKNPNAHGLYDMAGNVWEWVQDCYSSKTYSLRKNDMTNPIQESCSSSRYIVRGGSFGYDAQLLRASDRNGLDANTWVRFTGFRCVRN